MNNANNAGGLPINHVGEPIQTTDAATKATVTNAIAAARTALILVASNFADDAAAAVGGIAVGGLYHTSGAVKIRLS